MKAVYLLFNRLETSKTVEVGALGNIEFKPGTYIYVGSAMNSVEKRLERHFSGKKSAHWHIDYLTEKAETFDYFILPEESRFECIMAEILSGLCEEIEGFGASDCNCSTHLFRLPENFSR